MDLIDDRHAKWFHNLRVLPYDMINDDRLWRHQQGVQPLRNLRKLHPLSLEDLRGTNSLSFRFHVNSKITYSTCASKF